MTAWKANKFEFYLAGNFTTHKKWIWASGNRICCPYLYVFITQTGILWRDKILHFATVLDRVSDQRAEKISGLKYTASGQYISMHVMISEKYTCHGPYVLIFCRYPWICWSDHMSHACTVYAKVIFHLVLF